MYLFYKVLGVGRGRTLGGGSWQMDLDLGTSELDKCLCLGMFADFDAIAGAAYM